MDELFVAFMAVMVGGMLFVQLQLRGISKKLDPKDDGRDAREDESRDDLRRRRDDAAQRARRLR